MRKVLRIIGLSNKEKLLIIETLFYLAWAFLLKKKDFHKIAPSLGKGITETTHEIDDENIELFIQISKCISTVSKHTPWESKCLVQAIAGMKMLERRCIESTLYLGTARNDKGKMVAHAWLRSGTYILTGSEGIEKFTVVYSFAKELNKNKMLSKCFK